MHKLCLWSKKKVFSIIITSMTNSDLISSVQNKHRNSCLSVFMIGRGITDKTMEEHSDFQDNWAILLLSHYGKKGIGSPATSLKRNIGRTVHHMAYATVARRNMKYFCRPHNFLSALPFTILQKSNTMTSYIIFEFQCLIYVVIFAEV